jgi:phosphoglycolate phosphatase-like HAD superfamily hydrolase
MRAFFDAYRRVYARPFEGPLEASAKTELRIWQEMVRQQPPDDPGGGFRAFQCAYLRELESALDISPPVVLPGVVEFMGALVRNQCTIVFATGNSRAAALIKLNTSGLSAELARMGIPFQASFGDGSPGKTVIVRRAMQAALRDDEVPSHRRRACVLVGDSPYDMGAARVLGVTGVGVATGAFCERELRESGASAVFPDLANTAEVLRILLDDRRDRRATGHRTGRCNRLAAPSPRRRGRRGHPPNGHEGER